MSLTETSKERLLKLAERLDSVPPERFDYTSWAGNDWQGKADLSCGTTACALGWATTIPEFQALGLYLCRHASGTVDVTLSDGGPEVEDAWGAAERLFELDWSQAEYLFSPFGRREAKATAQDVAKKIRKFIASDGEVPEEFYEGAANRDGH